VVEEEAEVEVAVEVAVEVEVEVQAVGPSHQIFMGGSVGILPRSSTKCFTVARRTEGGAYWKGSQVHSSGGHT